jgi:hypothetical protein
MRTIIKLGCASLLCAALSYAVFSATEGRGAWPSSAQYISVLGMYGFTAVGTTFLVAACIFRLFHTLRRQNKTR